MNPRIYVLTLVTFAFGSGAFIFAGLLESLAADLGVTTAVAGQLQTVFVLTSAVLGPVAAWLFARVDRKIMVMTALALGAALHIACALTPNFEVLMVLRALAGLAGAMSGPAASVAAAALVPPERRGSALAMVSGGMTLAFVVGIPMGSIIGSVFDWRATFLFAAGLSLFALAAVVFFLPKVPAPPKREGGGDTVKVLLPIIWPFYLTTFLTFAANMTLNLYIAPIVRVGAGVTGAGVGAFQAMIGVGSIAGLWLGARAADRAAGRSWILQGFMIQAAAMSVHFAATHHVLPAGWPSATLVALGIFLAATALFSITPVIQSSLIQVTGGAPVALALNGSVISVGQALGSTVGGAALATYGVPAIPAAALAMSLTALITLTFLFPRAATVAEAKAEAGKV
ncbi:MFS transporter [Phenylobacterium sp.]|uniref:MFS transporter n=1 Tax=Phenylobacterium sp. TaxID=1871053 RepID=UPI0027374F45|nr:MFS transporter [Phenylobacterium sp.]MDP3632577.1 MFS transporter [Phenylobacterium sp.]